MKDRIGAGEKAQRLDGLPSSRRPAESRTIAFGMVIRATAIVRTNSNGSSALRPPSAACNGVPATCTR